jgi:UDP-2,3-diacylglucosamine pyrophosphatase LpxH
MVVGGCSAWSEADPEAATMTDPTPVPLDSAYVEDIRKRLDAVFDHAEERPLDPAADSLVIFSDHHKGIGDPADDFRRCEHAYTAALGYYLEAGYQLFVLGDSEELWEERAGPVIEHYGDVLGLEAQFARPGPGLERFYGNHDDQWASGRQVAKHLRSVFGDITVRDGLRLRVDRAGGTPTTLFFVHGHQGTADSDRWGRFSRLFVRHVWRPLQRRTGYSATTPSRDYRLRAKHDRAMHEWAQLRADRILIAGHTHRPVFGRCKPDPPPTRPIAELEMALEQAKRAHDAATAAAVRAELEYARTAVRRPENVATVSPPCYFNTGCCSFPDGDVTGLEIADGEIRLVRWPSNLREICRPGVGVDVHRRVLEREKLDDLFEALSGERAAGPQVLEHEIKPA